MLHQANRDSQNCGAELVTTPAVVGDQVGSSGTTRSSSAMSISPSKVDRAAAAEAARSLPGQKWVSISRACAGLGLSPVPGFLGGEIEFRLR